MKVIELTQGKVALVDDAMYEELNKHKWCAHLSGLVHYAERRLPNVNGKQKHLKMHHAVMGMPSKDLEIDHKDGNGLNNQRFNLHFVTKRQNAHNRKNITKTSKYHGVSWYARDAKWEACIWANGKNIYLGRYNSELVAHGVYRQALAELIMLSN